MREFNFIEGQLIPHGVPVEVATKVSDLASAGKWGDAAQLLEGDERATRILARIREVRR